MERLTIADVKRNNKKAGHYFFSKGAMRFFNSIIETGLLKQKYFVTSEQFNSDYPRLYTIKKITNGGVDIDTIGEFQGYKTLKEAKEAIKNLANKEKETIQ